MRSVRSVGVSHKRYPRYILPIGFAAGILVKLASIHAFGFAADKDSAMTLREGPMLAHAHERGYDIFSSNGYVAIDPQMDAESIRTRLRESGAVQDELWSELDSFDFELLWVHEPTRTDFIRFKAL